LNQSYYFNLVKWFHINHAYNIEKINQIIKNQKLAII